jgi:hypothetical protein
MDDCFSDDHWKWPVMVASMGVCLDRICHCGVFCLLHGKNRRGIPSPCSLLSIAPTLAKKWPARNFSANYDTLQNSRFHNTPLRRRAFARSVVFKIHSTNRTHFMATKIQIRNSTGEALVEACKKQVFFSYTPTQRLYLDTYNTLDTMW